VGTNGSDNSVVGGRVGMPERTCAPQDCDIADSGGGQVRPCIGDKVVVDFDARLGAHVRPRSWPPRIVVGRTHGRPQTTSVLVLETRVWTCRNFCANRNLNSQPNSISVIFNRSDDDLQPSAFGGTGLSGHSCCHSHPRNLSSVSQPSPLGARLIAPLSSPTRSPLSNREIPA
jgi:hypothetical protein